MKADKIDHNWPSDRNTSVFLEDLRMLTRSSYWDYFDSETKGIILTQLGVHHGYYKTHGCEFSTNREKSSMPASKNVQGNLNEKERESCQKKY